MALGGLPPWSGRAHLVRTMATAALVTTVLVVVAASPAVRAAAPPPSLDACLDGGSFNIAEPACQETHPPSWGDQFGPIGGIITHLARRGDAIDLAFNPGAATFYDRPISCGIGGCIGHSIAWRSEEGQVRGRWMETVSGCSGSDEVCSFRIWPDYDVGDEAERWWVLYVQHYRGIFPQKGEAHAFSVAPRYYPVRLDPVDTAGNAVEPRPGTVAYAVRSGVSPSAGSCVSGAWWLQYRRVVDPPVPDCIELDQTPDDFGREGYAGVLPVDTGIWNIVAAPAGDAAAPLISRPSPYRALSVEPVADDIRAPIVRERRPVPRVTVEPEVETLSLGATQAIAVTVAAVGGEVGSLTLAFDAPEVLEISPLEPPTLGLPDEDDGSIATVEPFTLAAGQEQTFLVQVGGLGEGVAALLARVSGTDDLGDPVAGDGAAAVAVVASGGGAGSAEAPEPPVVEVAVTGDAGGRVEGTAVGAPDTALTVTLWASRPGPDGACEPRQSGPDTAVVGSADVTLGEDGAGSFAFDVTLTEGWYTYGVSAIGARVSEIGECRQVVGDTPSISVADAQVVEGTAADGTTSLVFTVSLSGASDQPVSVRASTSGGTASSPADHEALTDVEIAFAPGETSAQLTVDVVPDADQEDDETVILTLSQAVNGRLPAPDATGPTSVATGTIVDDDAVAVADTPDVRGEWRWVWRTKHLGKTLTATYTITITDQDPETGEVKGRIKGKLYDPYPDFSGRVSGTVTGDRIALKVTGAGRWNGPIEGSLIERGGTLEIRHDEDPAKWYVLVKPRGS